MSIAQQEGTYEARFLTREEMAQVIAPVIEDGYSLFYETEDPCLVMLDQDDKPVLWANGLRKIPFQFADEEDFIGLCGRIMFLTELRFGSRDQPKAHAYIEPRRLRRFRCPGTPRR